LYWHFSSKEDLFSGMIAQLTQEINKKLRSILATKRRFSDLLLVFIKECLIYFYKHRQMARLFMSATQGFSDELREKMMLWHLQFKTVIAELIELGLKTGFFRPDLEMGRVVTALIGILFAFGSKQCWEEDWNQLEAEAVFIKDILTHGIAKTSEEDSDGEKNT
jgi:AcrR family transcriptional regulator